MTQGRAYRPATTRFCVICFNPFQAALFILAEFTSWQKDIKYDFNHSLYVFVAQFATNHKATIQASHLINVKDTIQIQKT